MTKKRKYTAFRADPDQLEAMEQVIPKGVPPSAFVRYCFNLGVWLAQQPAALELLSRAAAAPLPAPPARGRAARKAA